MARASDTPPPDKFVLTQALQPGEILLDVPAPGNSIKDYAARTVTLIHIDFERRSIRQANTVTEKQAMLDDYQVKSSIMLAMRTTQEYGLLFRVDQAKARIDLFNKRRRPGLRFFDHSNWGWEG